MSISLASHCLINLNFAYIIWDLDLPWPWAFLHPLDSKLWHTEAGVGGLGGGSSDLNALHTLTVAGSKQHRLLDNVEGCVTKALGSDTRGGGVLPPQEGNYRIHRGAGRHSSQRNKESPPGPQMSNNGTRNTHHHPLSSWELSFLICENRRLIVPTLWHCFEWRVDLKLTLISSFS